jgi:hypothetical protein
MPKNKISPKKRTGGQSEDDEESRSLHLSDLQGEENPNDLSMISNASDDEHEIHENDFNISGMENDESGMTESESFGTISEFPSMEENDMNQSFPEDSSLHLSDLNASNTSTNTTREEDSFGGKRKTKRRRKMGTKSKVTFKKSGSKSKNRKTKKHRKTLKRKHHKKKKGGFVGDNGTDMERYGETNPYSVEMDSDPRY